MLAEMSRSKLTAAGMAALLVLSVFASMPVAAQEESVSVETLPPIKVTEDKAELEGNLTELDNASNATVWFEYWPENDSANATATENLTVSTVGTFVIDAEDLESNTTYVAEAHAATENASAEGGEITFTTEAEPPLAVSTEEPTNVTNSSATFHGELTRLDGEGAATVWFEYWAQGDRTDPETTANQSLGAPGEFNASVDDLEPGTTYFVQAHGEAENETVAGAAVKFETETGPMPLGVETNAASGVTNDSATLNGELTGLGGADSADVWFEWWEQGDSANASTAGNDTLDEPGAFSADLSGLANNTTYVYVAHAEANNTTVTGDEVEFTTGAAGDAGPTWDGEGAFGRWLTSVLKNIVPADGTPFGQLVSDIVTANNPGSEQRSDKANPGGNSSGPPEHAGPPGDDANSTDDYDERGPPEHAGPPDDANSTDDDDEENGPPDDAGPPDDNESGEDDDEDNGQPDDAGSSDDDDDGENGPPDHAGPPDDDEDEEDSDEDEGDDRDDEDDERDEQEDAGSEDGEDEDEDDDEEDEDDDDGENEGEGPPDEHPGQGEGQ